MKKLKILKLFCFECNIPIGEPRNGKQGKQKELCDTCRVQRKKDRSRRQWLARRAAQILAKNDSAVDKPPD